MAEIAVTYEFDGRTFEGVIAYDESVSAKRPVMFVQPDWSGVSRIMIDAAMAAAGPDYVVLIADMFGQGYASRPKDFDQLLAGMLAVHKDRDFTVNCGAAAFKALLAAADEKGLVDMGAAKSGLGYCAGGGFLLEQARAGEDLDAVAVLHVTNPNPVVPGTPCNIKGKVLAIHGAADPVTSKEGIHALEAELTEAGVDWRTMMLGEGRHAFCVPKESPDLAVRYDANLCRLSYMLVRDLFAEANTASGA